MLTTMFFLALRFVFLKEDENEEEVPLSFKLRALVTGSET